MGIPKALSSLIETDGLRELRDLPKRAFIHNDHRWVLPIIAWAQSEGLIDRPCLLAMFDYHTDFDPHFSTKSDKWHDLAAAYNTNPTVDEALQMCSEHLARNDSDWVSGGMELGIIGDAFALGPKVSSETDDASPYIDRQKRKHRFWSLPLPLAALVAHSGPLADYRCRPPGLWETLDWEPETGLGKLQHSLVLDFDLDAFAFDHDLSPQFAWPDKIFARQFPARDAAHSACWMPVRDFMNQLIDRSSIITIAREPCYCGGEEDCNTIFKRVKRYILMRNRVES